MDLNKVATLTIIASIEHVMKGNVMKGAFLGKIRKLAKLCRVPKVSEYDIYKIKMKLQEFEDKSGWAKKERHIATLINFCLILAENYNVNPKIITLLAELYEHIDRKHPVPDACSWAADVAAKKWNEIKI